MHKIPLLREWCIIVRGNKYNRNQPAAVYLFTLGYNKH